MLRINITIDLSISEPVLQYPDDVDIDQILDEQYRVCMQYINARRPITDVAWFKLLISLNNCVIAGDNFSTPDTNDDKLGIVASTALIPNWWLIIETNNAGSKYEIYDQASKSYKHIFVKQNDEYQFGVALIGSMSEPSDSTSNTSKKTKTTSTSTSLPIKELTIPEQVSAPNNDDNDKNTNKTDPITEEAYHQLCGEYEWNNKIVKITLSRLDKDVYVPRHETYLCQYMYNITFINDKNDDSVMLGINAAHLVSLMPLAHVRTREAIMSMLSMPDGYQYRLPIEFIPRVTSPAMVEAIEVLVQGFAADPSMVSASTLPDISSSFPMHDTDASLKWYGPEVHTRAFECIPGPFYPEHGTMPITETETRRALGKRMFSKLRRLRKSELIAITALAQNDAKRFPRIQQNVYKEGCFLEWSEKFVTAHGLTVPQARIFYACAAVCEYYYQQGPNALCQLLLSQFDLCTKTFIKDEIEEESTTLRFIISPSTYVKIILGPMFTAFEDELFYKPDSILYDHTIAGKNTVQVVDLLNNFNELRGENEVICQTDISAFEASQCGYAVDLEFIYYQHVLGLDPVCLALLNAYKLFQASQSTLNNKIFQIVRAIIRLSGLNNTSKGNYLLNYINMVVINSITKFIFEGDDGLVIVSKDRVQQIMQDSIFPLQLIESDTVYGLDFCGYHLDSYGNRVSKDWRTFWCKINTYFSRQRLSWQKECQLLKLRLISYQFMYPNDPNVKIAYDIYKSYWRDREVPIDFKTYRTFVQSNWWRMQQRGFVIPYVRCDKLRWFAERVPKDLSELQQAQMSDMIEDPSFENGRLMELSYYFSTRVPNIWKKCYLVFMFVIINVVRLVRWLPLISYKYVCRIAYDKTMAFAYAKARFGVGVNMGLDDDISKQMAHAMKVMTRFRDKLAYHVVKLFKHRPTKAVHMLANARQLTFGFRRKLYEAGEKARDLYDNLIRGLPVTKLSDILLISKNELTCRAVESVMLDSIDLVVDDSIRRAAKDLCEQYDHKDKGNAHFIYTNLVTVQDMREAKRSYEQALRHELSVHSFEQKPENLDLLDEYVY